MSYNPIFFFEIDEADGLKQYGESQENYPKSTHPDGLVFR